MKEYIEREKLIRNAELCRETTDAFMELIKDQEAADVQEVVTCGECKWWTKQEASLQGRCELSGGYPTAGWFCANGRKKIGADMRGEQE